ncbi:asparagine synthase (glutamine-hydrolyzing) [Parerythrobacter lacustris]|uniref:asparagine synthase (glutamine-hydrolyzing) n=1 Tax=Parerythrobacter lacustris TaxID=2969984 RepID=A0ABT1XRW4_9SPHN|nr:asparagine synthase (glutamine-hydrolyzing) [Parerythrobacter lacustris]MCR2834400.1 asparagine synthase (glutamine-hydrolyzing) [Parerythrobacter lacustris]
MTGFLGFGAAQGDPRGTLKAMADRIAHRGPDAEGFWVDEDAQVALAHLRLSIIDLSPAGAQPMHSHDGRWTLAYNGEIYNYTDLRADLEARHGPIAWRGHSDSEVLLEAFARDGIQPVLDRVDGMFAIALFDRQERKLTLIRDAFGEKPLVYGLWNGSLLFASELKAMQALPGFRPEMDLGALGDFFKYSYIPGPKTIWRGFAKLPPAHRVTLSLDDVAQGTLPEPEAWWDPVADALAARGRMFDGSVEEARAAGDALLLASTGRRMMADVPLGAFLSGGIDSSMTVALMQAQASRPVRTFSIGMAEEGFDESPAAAAVARHLGTDHTELVLTPAEVQDAVPQISGVHDEPFADSSQVPTFLVSRMARAHVTVALSGDGGDEIFGGYNRYFTGPKAWRRVAWMPATMRKALGGALSAVPPGLVDTLGGKLSRELAAGRASEKVRKLARAISTNDETAFHDRLLATADAPQSLLTRDIALSCLAARQDARAAELDFAHRAMLVDTANYMPDDVLVKVDRAAMAVALETRTPYLERELYRFAWSLPAELRAGGGVGKRLLREMLYARVPRELVDRPKAGFAIPVGRWLRSGLRDWAESELSRDSLGSSGLLDVAAIRRRWDEHLTGQRDHETLLWNVLMFQAWQRGQHG